jgi:hypothetical protein
MPEIESEAKEMGYDMEEVKKLKEQKVPAESQTDTSSEATTKNIRLANMGLANVTQYGSKVAEITEWYTYLNQDDSEQKNLEPYVLTVANDMFLLRAIPLKEARLPRFPFASYGIFTRGITFWSPSVADVARDPNLAINLAINQIMDNNTYRNFGMMFVSSDSGLKQSSIVPRPLGVTTVTVQPTQNVKDKVWQFTPPDIGSASSVMQIINSFTDNSLGLGSGVPAGHKGKISVTQQAALQTQQEMKLQSVVGGVLDCFREIFQLYADTAQMNFTVPRDVKIFGEKQLTIENVTRKNLRDVKFIAKAIQQESRMENKAIKQKARTTLFELLKDDPMVPGQIALRRDLAKQFDISPTVVESFFEKDDNQPSPQPQPSGQPSPISPIPSSPTPASPLLGQTQQVAQSQVPPAIK